jgi:hypothetical protein
VFVTFVSYQALGNDVTPAVLFTTLSLLISTQFFLTILFPFATEFYSNYKAGSKRFTELLMLPEYEDVAKPADEVGLVELENVSASWYKKDANAEADGENVDGYPIQS